MPRRILYAAPVLLLALGACSGSATGSASIRVAASTSAAAAPAASSSTPPSPTPSVDTASRKACEAENEMAYEVSGPLTDTQVGELAAYDVILLHASNAALAASVDPKHFTAAAMSRVLAVCAVLGYIPGAAPIASTVATPPPLASSAPPSASSSPSPSPSPTESQHRPGESDSFTIDDADAGTITPGVARVFTTQTDGLAPANGFYVAITVKVQAIGKTVDFPISPEYFYVRTASGGHFNLTFDLAIQPPMLDLVDLNPGENTSGSLVFDIPVKSNFQLVYAPNGDALAEWQY